MDMTEEDNYSEKVILYAKPGIRSPARLLRLAL